MLTGAFEEVEAPIGSVNCARAAAEGTRHAAVTIEICSDLRHSFRKQSPPTIACEKVGINLADQIH